MTDRWQREDEARQARLLEKLIRRLPADNYTRGAGRVAEPTTVRRSVTPAAPLAPTDPNVDGVPVGGDLAGVLPNPTVDGLQGFAVGTAAPGNGQVLTWSTATSQWAPAAASGGVDELSDLSDVGTAVPTDGQVLTYSTASAEWAPADSAGGGLTQGTVTVATAATTGTAAHGLGFTPYVEHFQVTPLGAWGSAASFWADSVDGTNMVVAVNTAPGTAVPFAWRHTGIAVVIAGFPAVGATSMSTSTGTSHSFDIPAGSVNDLVVVFATRDSTNITWTEPTDFTDVSTNTVVQCWWWIATDARTTDTFSTSGSRDITHHVYRIDTGTFNTTTPVSFSGPDTNTLDPPSLSPAWGSAKTLWITGCRSRTNTTVTGTPASYTNMIENVAATDVTSGSARRELEASSEDPAAWTVTSSDAPTAWTAAIRPA